MEERRTGEAMIIVFLRFHVLNLKEVQDRSEGREEDSRILRSFPTNQNASHSKGVKGVSR